MERIRKIKYSSRFKKNIKRLPFPVKQKILKLEKIFMNNPFDPHLDTHKLHGKMKNYYSFSLTHSLRIIFEFINNETVGFVDIGPHSIYK